MPCFVYFIFVFDPWAAMAFCGKGPSKPLGAMIETGQFGEGRFFSFFLFLLFFLLFFFVLFYSILVVDIPST